MNTDLKRWLDTATKGLPDDIIESVREELLAHYEDALEDYTRHGITDEQAQSIALADLGDARETGQALRQTHLAARKYIFAAVMSIAPLLLMLVSLFLSVAALFAIVGYTTDGAAYEAYIASGMMFVIGVFSVYATSHVLKTLQFLIGVYSLSIRLPVRLIQFGLLTLIIPTFVTVLMSHVQMPDSLNVSIVSNPIVYYDSLSYDASQAMNPYPIAVSVSVVLVGVGWILLGLRLDKYRQLLYGLSLPLCFIMIVSGAGLVMLAVNIFRYTLLSWSVWVSVALMMGVIKSAVFTLLFFRAAYANRTVSGLRA